jgi:cytochrome oxidase Cu insertion factor (SCO1/SenC/PrrC family)
MLAHDDAKRATSSARRTLLLLALVCLAPVVAGYWLFYFSPPSRFINYGDLLTGSTVASVRWKQPDGSEFNFEQLHGKWLLVSIDSGNCDDHCREKLTFMRQLRLSQGKDSERIERVWLIDDAVRPQHGFMPQFDGTREIFTGDASTLDQFPAPHSRRAHIYVIDPLGNVMLRFPRNPEPKAMINDITRLLKVSRIG